MHNMALQSRDGGKANNKTNYATNRTRGVTKHNSQLTSQEMETTRHNISGKG